jgi:hypothetical protein
MSTGSSFWQDRYPEFVRNPVLVNKRFSGPLLSISDAGLNDGEEPHLILIPTCRSDGDLTHGL